MSAADFLLELRCEEIPARMQAGARAELEKAFRASMAAAGVSHGEITVWSTPRRLALIARGLPERTEAVREEIKGPKAGAPPQALEGFLRKVGLTRDQLEDRGGTLFAVIERPGRATAEVLSWAITSILLKFPWPKSMRWGAASLSTESPRWVRPLSGIVAILGEELIGCQFGDVASSYATMGHRFHHDGPITIGGAHDYAEKLRACHVIVDHEERQDLIRIGAAKAASGAGLALVADEGLVIENGGLTEWPVPLLGRFDEAYLDVPPEVIQLTARTNQKYFVCNDAGGKLANAFVCTANIEAADGGAAIVDGNRKVLAARLSDARFFWEQDRKTPLANHAKKLERITFHEKLGTVADKVERVAKLARWLVEEGIVRDTPLPLAGGAGGGPVDGGGFAPTPDPSRKREGELADQAETAARLAKADLVTEMVGEFPELQGLMGGYYARAEGLPDAVADAIRDHYKPVGQGDEVPTAPVTVAVSLADKLDTLVALNLVRELATGSKDPFALRRAAIGVCALILENGLRFSMGGLVMLAWGQAVQSWNKKIADPRRSDAIDRYLASQGKIREIGNYAEFIASARPDFLDDVLPNSFDASEAFLIERLKVQQREAGVRHDLIDAVFALGGEDDLVRLLARVHALQAFMATEDGANLLAGYKRAANIIKKEDWHPATTRIAETGGEDPMSDVDDPAMAAVYAARAAEKNALSYTPEPAEEALIAALDSAEPTAASAVEGEDFGAAMAALATLRAPIDRLFDSVTVNDPDPAKRTARLALLARFRDAVHRVADFSRIEG